MFVTERAGACSVLRDGVRQRTFLDLTAITLDRRLRARAAVDGVRARLRDLRALLRLSDRERAARATIADARVPALGATRTSPTRPAARLLLTIPHDEAGNHNGGQLQFGPDGKLWLATGDGGGGNDQSATRRTRARCSAS